MQSHLSSPEVTTPTGPHAALAHWLVTGEMDAQNGPLTGSAGAERVFKKLSQRLAQLITPVGSEALLMRAVHLSRAEFPFLGGVPGAPNTQSLIERLAETALDVDPSEAQAGFVSVLGTLIDLLVSFIGEDLTFRLLRDVWPALPMRPRPPPDAQP